MRLEVAEEDRGRVIGRSGKTAMAIRTLVGAVARARAALSPSRSRNSGERPCCRMNWSSWVRSCAPSGFAAS
ncbi:KH domain-containing protein [bacterium]|nr:KH domain-containing protein [bacterium]